MGLAQTDSYKLSHKGFMNPLTNAIQSNFTARSAKHFPVIHEDYDNKYVVFNLQKFVMEYLIDYWNTFFFSQPKEKVIAKFKRLIDGYLGAGEIPMEHFEALHDVGYLPIHIKSIDEGCRVNIRVPFFSITNTFPEFAWLTNYLETVISCELWKPITVATLIYEFRKMVNKYALETTGSLDFTMFQLHDFSFRGMPNRQDAATCSAAFLLSSCGTDTIPAIEFLEDYYGADVTKELIGTSVPASEHSVACLDYAQMSELESYRKWITVDYPKGIVSLVSDTTDYWRVLTEYLPALKEDILARPANSLGLSKVVVRPDSGNPVNIVAGYRVLNETFINHGLREMQSTYAHIRKNGIEVVRTSTGQYRKIEILQYDVCLDYRLGSEVTEAEIKGSIQLLWETFGGTETEQGYKLLDSHIGLIYGDSITMPIAKEIFDRLKEKGFASTNVVFGVGSYTMQYLTRDSLGMAIKATYAEVDGVPFELSKSPVTDSGVKKSAKGLLRVEKVGDDYVLHEQQTREQEATGELTTLFLNGALVKRTTLAEIRERLWG